MDERERARPRASEVVGYCCYDFANSSYTTLISTVAYSLYFRQVVVGASDHSGDLLWSLAQVIALSILIVVSPLLGAVADHSGRKKRFLAWSTLLTVVACASLALVGPGDVAAGIALLVLGTVGFESGYVFYNAFLPEVATPRTMSRVSGLSWGVGFLGGLAALVASAPLLARPLVASGATLPDPRAAHDYRLSFLVVAAFFGLFALPTFALLRERQPRHVLRSFGQFVRVGWRRVADTLSHLSHHRAAAQYVLAVLCFYGGIETVIKFSAIYAAVSFGIQGQDLVWLFVFTNVVAVPGTLLAGVVADRVGAPRALALTLVGWIVLVLAGVWIRTPLAFWILASGIAVGMGSSQAIGRSLMAQLAPPERESEFFGFYLMASKVGAILSLLLFGGVSAATGSQRAAVLSILPFFVAGLALLGRVGASVARGPEAPAPG